MVNDRWRQVALSSLMISCINLRKHLWAFQLGLIYYEFHILNNVGTSLLLLMRVAIQVVCCPYMLTPCVEYLWYVKF